MLPSACFHQSFHTTREHAAGTDPQRRATYSLSREVFFMKSFPLRYAAIVLVMVIVAGAWFFPLPEAIPSTYASAFALIIGVAAVTFITWRNALPTDTIGQLLQRTESDEAGRRARGGSSTSTRDRH